MPFILGSCSKDKRAERKIEGKWEAYSIDVSSWEIMNQEWLPNSAVIRCNNGGTLSSNNRYKYKEFIMDFGEDGIVNESSIIIHQEIDTIETQKGCKLVIKPEYSTTKTSNYSWEISEKGKFLSLTSTYGNHLYITEYEIIEITKSDLTIATESYNTGQYLYYVYKLKKQ